MTVLRATPFGGAERGAGLSLYPGVSPGRIRAALFAEDRAVFDAAYAEARHRAAVTGDEAELHEVVERWRQIAILEQDREDFQRVARRAAELLTGEAVPADEPLAVTRARTGF